MLNPIPDPAVLFDLSDTTLQDLLMASLDRRSRHIKTVQAAAEEAAREDAIAFLAEYLLKFREELLEVARVTLEAEKSVETVERVA